MGDSVITESHSELRTTARQVVKGVGWLILAAILASVLLSTVVPALRGPRRYCPSNLRMLAVAAQLYTQDWEGALPPGDRWADQLLEYAHDARLFRCPHVQHPRGWQGSDYGFNSALSSQTVRDLAEPSACPMLFESSTGLAKDGSWNVSDPLTSFIPRHEGKGHIAYADGHVRAVKTPPDAYAGLLMPDAGEPSE